MSLKALAACALTVLAGCSGAPDVSDPPPAETGKPDPDADSPDRKSIEVGGHPAETALDRVDANLARLRALDVVEVGDLIVELPEEATNCYGPCPGSEAAIQQAELAAAERLEEFVDVAEAASGVPNSYLCIELVDENIAALQGLAIVEVLGMIETVPQNNPQCYNLPCQEDIDAAAADNEARAARLDNIARDSSEL